LASPGLPYFEGSVGVLAPELLDEEGVEDGVALEPLAEPVVSEVELDAPELDGVLVLEDESLLDGVLVEELSFLDESLEPYVEDCANAATGNARTMAATAAFTFMRSPWV